MRRSGLRNRKREDYNKLANSKVNKLIQISLKSYTSEHVDEALNTHWIECLLNCFDKMHNSGTLSCLFPRSNLPKGTKVLPAKLSFEVKLTDVRSKLIQGQYYTLSYAPTVDTDSFKLTTTVAASDKTIVVLIYTSNTFQTNVILDPNKRVYITLLTMYLDWFRARFPNHPLEKCKNSKEFVM